MKKTALVVLGFLAMSLNVFAQSDIPAYRLRTPTQEEYINAISDLEIAMLESQQALALDSAILGEMAYRYPNLFDADFATLQRIYDELNLGHSWVGDSRHTWNVAMVNAALRESLVDFTSANSLAFEDYTIEITPVDFDSDGVDEYILNVLKNPSTDYYAEAAGEYQGYMVAVRDGEGYRVMAMPLPWNGEPSSHWTVHHLTPRRFEDVNGDGILEWLVDGWRSNTGPSARPSISLYIVGWRDEMPVSLIPDDSLSTLSDLNDVVVSWEFENRDADNSLELVQIIRHHDNWGCNFSTVSIAQWDESQLLYVMGESEAVFEAVPGCTWRTAEEAMWAGDYEQAITLYEAYLSSDTSSDYYDVEDRQYIRLRLAIALAFVGRSSEATALLDELYNETPATSGMGALITIARLTYANQDELDLCTAAYNFFTPYNDGTIGQYRGPITRYVGQTLVDGEMFVLNASPSNPAHSGCDMPTIIDTLLAEQRFTTNTAPDEQLSQLGLEVDGIFQESLNGDNAELWIVWLKVQVPAIVFVPQGETYTLSRVQFESPYSSLTLRVIELPDASGAAIAILTSDVSSLAGYFSCVDATGQRFTPLREFSLWRLGENGLHSTFYTVLCESLGFDELLQNDNRELLAWTAMDDGYLGGTALPSVYMWDSQQQGYVLSLVNGEPYVPPVYESDSFIQPAVTIGTAIGLFRSSLIYHTRETSEALAQFDAVMTTIPSDTNPEAIWEARYCYAILLEDVERGEDALAQYITIYDSASDSAWGELAALHLERID